MLEGEGSGLSGGAAGDSGAVSDSSVTDSTGAANVSGGSGAASLASGDGGSAPAVPGDAAQPVAGQVPASAAAASEFLFGGRRWQSQKQAEDAWRSMMARTPTVQREAEELKRTLSQRDAELEALRQALAGRSAGGQPPQGQGAQQQGRQAPDASAPFVERLAQDGSLDFLASLLQTGEGEDPTLGVKRFTLGLADMISREVEGRVAQVQEQHIAPILRQQKFSEHMGRAMGVARSLASSDFPELDDSNASPEAVEHQQAFMANLKQFPPEFVAANPDFSMLAAALVTRYQNGTPVFAQEPGTSGSPSARAIAASEMALGAAAPNPLGGTGTPRPRPNGAGETPEDRIRRENAAAPMRIQTPGGRDLGFGPA